MEEVYTYESPFELSIVPITRPESKPDCEIDLMHHEFGNCYYKPYVGPYTPDEKCKGKIIKKAILTWKGYCKGTQYDRVAAVWIDGIEILRTSTAEPTQIGLSWEFSVDITRYRSLFYKDRTLTVSLNNIVNDQYTGSFIIDIKLEIYLDSTPNISKPEPIYQRPADDFIGISQFGQNSEPWYTIENNKSIKFKLPQISSSTQRALLEVFITGHGKEEFHQFNTPDDPRKEGDQNTRGPLRELHVSVNGIEAGVGWPFPVIFTGGVCPALWRPISGIGSFSADPIRFEFSQFIGDLIKNSNSEIELLVSPSIPFWHITGNLHLWYSDDEIKNNSGMLNSNSLKFSINPQVETNFDNSAVNFKTKANRSYLQKGYIDRKDGRIQVETSRKLTFHHDLQYFKDTDKQIYDFTANVITETRFLHFPPELEPDNENQAGVQELHKESFDSKWRFFGQTEYQPCEPYGSLIDASMTADVSHKDYIGDQLVRELNVSQHNTGVFGRIPDMPFVIDGSSNGTVNYFNKYETEEERFNRSIKTEHGWTVQDSNNTRC
ncbi:hypothetical protein CONCODRAFT_77356 [Conidiobolus coronatus NRRL 28638]|uniref:Peptide N-acetyl-beta-D-glucosaminyl asparaginase amidase A N-terminal domain-containing protein n=1 Tax=Conidiobolus coronatus (strain ATCC 28846 / CBS 209.66 / NRRL 28638) TaxID=796925 RepID=A0A137PEF5_CONC2|nr:hypothetical protein CONCODRAFT_77356 [Conidiobolus coronatus NRRL 28638]|eukprot:KXN73386.1 hypothetical protein CONCODRAFT_77356 [Conidiobolus coronatus NRRL 28638]